MSERAERESEGAIGGVFLVSIAARARKRGVESDRERSAEMQAEMRSARVTEQSLSTSAQGAEDELVKSGRGPGRSRACQQAGANPAMNAGIAGASWGESQRVVVRVELWSEPRPSHRTAPLRRRATRVESACAANPGRSSRLCLDAQGANLPHAYEHVASRPVVSSATAYHERRGARED